MSMVNRAAGRSGKTKPVTNNVTTKQSVTVKQAVIKTEIIKVVEKEKKQPTPDQIRLATLTDTGDTHSAEIEEKIVRVKDITCKTEDEVVTALHDCSYNVDEAITYLLEGKNDGWSTTTKKKKSRAASASKNDAEMNNVAEASDNADQWNKEAHSGSGQPVQRISRGFRGRRGGSTRTNDRGSFSNNRRFRDRENKENERIADDRGFAGGSGRDYRGGRGDRMTNGPPRTGRGGRGPRGGRGLSGTRTFQSRDNNERSGGGGGFPHQIDTWNNPDTENARSKSKAEEFPCPEEWDNEEYTGSLADSKVFTPSTAVDSDVPNGAGPSTEQDVKDESIQLHSTIQSPPNAGIPSMVVAGSNQLTPLQAEYFSQLTAQANENRKQQAQQNSQQSTPTKPQQSYASVNASQSFSSMVTSQNYQQPPSTISGSTSYSRPSAEYASSNYSDVMTNYNSMLQSNGALPQRSKPQRQPSRQDTPTKGLSSSVDIPSAEGGMNSAMKYLDGAFSSFDLNGNDKFDTSSVTSESGVAALSNKYVATNAPAHADLPAINTFQGTQAAKPNLSNNNIAAVLNQNSQLATDTALQNDSVYSSQTITNSRIGSGIQDLKNNSELSYGGIAETYQSSQSSTFQKLPASASSSFHQSGSSITSTANSGYSNQQTQQPQQQQVSQSQTGVTYATTSTSSFSVYSSNSHSVATAAATPHLHNSVYPNNSYQPHPSVTASFQSYMSYPSFQPYQANAAGLTQTPYLNTQYGGGSIASLGATYGAAPYPNSYGIGSNLQTPVAAALQNHKISSSLSTSVASKESQFDNLQTIASGTGNSATTTNGNVISGLSQTSTTTSSKVSSNSTSGSKTSGMLPSVPPGVQPLIGPAGPQYIMSQGSLPLYQPAFALNYDDLQYIQRGMHPHMPTGYLDINYATAPQTNIAQAGREALNVPFSTISDGRFSRPENTTSPVPPAAAAAGASLSQQNAAPAHQQPHLPTMLQTYAYIYPPTQQYMAPVYQVAPTATAAAPGASNNAAITGAQFAKAQAGYSSTGYASQFESLAGTQGNVADYAKGGSSVNSYSNAQPANKAANSAASVASQNSNAANADLQMYGKSHASLTKSYETKAYHSNTPPPFTMTGSGSTSNSLGNASNATGYAPQLFISNVPNAAAQHHLNTHHQDGSEIRNSGTNDNRNYFLANSRSYR